MSTIGLSGNGSCGHALERLRVLLRDGAYPRNSRLPAERELALELGIGRSTLRKVLAVLEAEGRIWRHVGQGTFVGARSSDARPPPFLDVHAVAPRDLLEARLVLEPAIAAQAASTARPGDTKKMLLCAEKREAAQDPAAYNLWDHGMHLAIAEATQNPLLVALIEQLNELRSQPLWAAYKRQRMTSAFRAKSAAEHRSIIGCIEARDPRGAFEAMRVHILNIQESFSSWS